MTAKERFKKAALTRQAGCPLFEGRELADLEAVEGEIVTLVDAFPLTGKKGRYYVVVFKEYPNNFFFSCKALTDIIDEGAAIANEENISLAEVIEGVAVSIQAMERTKDGNRFRPVHVVE